MNGYVLFNNKYSIPENWHGADTANQDWGSLKFFFKFIDWF